MHHTVRSRVLRADIDHVFFRRKDLARLFAKRAVRLDRQTDGVVPAFFDAKIQFGIGGHVVILAQGIPYEILTQVQPAHVLVPGELDAQKVIDFAFVQFGRTPDIAHGGQHGIFPVGGKGLEHDPMAVRGGGEMVDHAQPDFRTFVHAGQTHQIVERHIGLVAQHQGHFPQFVRRNGKRGILSFLVRRIGGKGRYFFLYCAHKFDFIIRYRP